MAQINYQAHNKTPNNFLYIIRRAINRNLLEGKILFIYAACYKYDFYATVLDLYLKQIQRIITIIFIFASPPLSSPPDVCLYFSQAEEETEIVDTKIQTEYLFGFFAEH